LLRGTADRRKYMLIAFGGVLHASSPVAGGGGLNVGFLLHYPTFFHFLYYNGMFL
jgi:hypothetical protein